MTPPFNRRYFFIDTETSALKGRVCELAVVETDVTGTVLHAAASLIDPEEKISPEAMGVHHITDQMVATEPTLAEYFGIHGRFLASEGAVYIGHNVGFDIDTIARHSLDFLSPPTSVHAPCASPRRNGPTVRSPTTSCKPCATNSVSTLAAPTEPWVIPWPRSIWPCCCAASTTPTLTA